MLYTCIFRKHCQDNAVLQSRRELESSRAERARDARARDCQL